MKPLTAPQIRAAVERTTPWREASTGGQAIAAALRVARGASRSKHALWDSSKSLLAVGSLADISHILPRMCQNCNNSWKPLLGPSNLPFPNNSQR